MNGDNNQNDTSVGANISGAVEALSSMKDTLNQMMAPAIPDTVSGVVASLSAMSETLAQAAGVSIPDSLTNAAAKGKIGTP